MEALLSGRTRTDAQWARIAHRLPGQDGDRGRSGTDTRPFVEAVLWLARGASPWRDPPAEPGQWRTVHTRLRRWSRAGVRESPFRTLAQDPGLGHVLVEAAIRKGHADAASHKGGSRLARSAAPAAG